MTSTLLETREEKNYKGEVEIAEDYLVLEPMHYNGTYKVGVRKETHKGYFSEFVPFANGNFNIRLKDGRKSSKKLEKLEQYLNKNREELTDAWLKGKYQYMVDTIVTDVIAEKIV